MRELPTIDALANAPLDIVLRLWEGLGYYSRARNLQKAARILVARHRGRIPDDPSELLELPGIGRYTAGAIGSIAFDRPDAILDGNIIRVFCRLRVLPGDPRAPELNRRLWSLAAAVVVAAKALPAPAGVPRTGLRFAGNCSRMNQALMELGATVCRVSNPDCGDCPLNSICRAHALRAPHRFPTAKAGPKVVQRRLATVVWSTGPKWLIRRRSDDEVNGGFWEFPNQEIARDTDAAAALAGWLRVPVDSLEPRGRCRHSITRYRIVEEIFSLTRPPGRNLPAGELRWVDRETLAAIPLTGAHRRIKTRLVDNHTATGTSGRAALPRPICGGKRPV